jgi:hypothetical protein
MIQPVLLLFLFWVADEDEDDELSVGVTAALGVTAAALVSWAKAGLDRNVS